MGARIVRIKGRLYDTKTTNKTFLRVASDLKKLGIKNWYFMLEIRDHSLVSINPYAVDKEGRTTLTRDQVTRIMTECALNPWYFLREISRIPKQGGTVGPYKANRGNIAQSWCIWKGIDSWLCLRRQKGKTESAVAFQTWMYLFGTSNSQFIFVNKDGENAKANLRRMVNQLEALPEYMQCSQITDKDGNVTKSKKSATKLENAVNGNIVTVKPKATSYETALSLARGLSAPVLHFDEPEFTNHIKTIVENSVSTFEEAAAIARENHAMAARIFTCTPGDLDTAQGQESQQLLDKTCKWTERMYDMSENEIEEYIAAQGEDCNQIVYIEYSYKQTGDTEDWLRKISAKINNPLTVRREILLQRLHGSDLSPFDREDMEYISETVHKPIDELWILDYYRFDIYKRLDKRIPYIVGVDCATGTNQDNNAITILDPYTVQPVAEFECNYIGETMFENVLKELMKVIPRAVLCIERNSMGDGIIDHLLHSQIAARLYFDKNRDLVDEKIKKDENIQSILKDQVNKKRFYGVYTEKGSREDMMTILARHVKEFKDDFITKNIIRDITRLIRKASGRVEAGPGFHDDSVMSYLICLYVYYHGNNLASFGIQKGMKDLGPENHGMKQPDEIDPTLVDPKLINNAKEQIMKEKIAEKELNWNAVMADAISKAQQETYQRYQKKLLDDTIYEHTPATVMENYEDEGSISMSFFDDMNGFGKNRNLVGVGNNDPFAIPGYNDMNNLPPLW